MMKQLAHYRTTGNCQDNTDSSQGRGSYLRRLGVSLLTAFFLCLSLAAASHEELGQRLVRESESIFVGDLVHSESFQSDRDGMIMTRHVFRVNDSLKGESGSYVEIVEYGGTLGEVSLEVSHSARYYPGSEYLIFSARDQMNQSRTLGGAIGAIPVVKTDDNVPQLRLLPNHPLASLVGADQRALFLDLNQLQAAISPLIEVQ